MKRIVLLGASGSIGVQTVDIVQQHPDLFEMVKFCKDNGIKTVIFTSGIKRASAMTVEMIEYIKNIT